MTRKIIIMMIVGFFAAAMPGAILAGESRMWDSGSRHYQGAAESVNTVDADNWPAAGPVETGAIPDEMSKPSQIHTDFDRYDPELRRDDKSTGG